MLKRLLIVVLFFTVGLQLVFAQPAKGRRRAVKRDGQAKVSSDKEPGQILKNEKLKSELNLSEEQQVQIREILVESQKKVASIQEKANKSIKLISEEAIDDIRLLLTLEQQEKWKNYLEINKGKEFVSGFPPSPQEISQGKNAEIENIEVEEESAAEEEE